MIKSLIKLVAFLVIAILGYNYFLGSEEEKEQSKEIVGTVAKAGKQIIGTVGTLLKQENQKFKEGKYDDAFQKVEKVLSEAKDRAQNTKSNVKNILDALGVRKDKLKESLDKELKKGDVDKDKIKELQKEFEELTNDIQETLESEKNK